VLFGAKECRTAYICCAMTVKGSKVYCSSQRIENNLLDRRMTKDNVAHKCTNIKFYEFEVIHHTPQGAFARHQGR